MTNHNWILNKSRIKEEKDWWGTNITEKKEERREGLIRKGYYRKEGREKIRTNQERILQKRKTKDDKSYNGYWKMETLIKRIENIKKLKQNKWRRKGWGITEMIDKELKRNGCLRVILQSRLFIIFPMVNHFVVYILIIVI